MAKWAQGFVHYGIIRETIYLQTGTQNLIDPDIHLLYEVSRLASHPLQLLAWHLFSKDMIMNPLKWRAGELDPHRDRRGEWERSGRGTCKVVSLDKCQKHSSPGVIGLMFGQLIRLYRKT